MATIRRHPVPAEFYEPDRPLNDLRRDQLKHFAHIAQLLPAHLKVDLPVPSPESGIAATHYIAAVTERLMSAKKPLFTLVPKRKPKAAPAGLAIAAQSEAQPQLQAALRKPKPRIQRKPGKRGA